VRKFAQFVLDDANGFVQGALTQEAAEALQTLTDRKRKAQKDAKRRKKQKNSIAGFSLLPTAKSTAAMARTGVFPPHPTVALHCLSWRKRHRPAKGFGFRV
jgi:hypothetical protein